MKTAHNSASNAIWIRFPDFTFVESKLSQNHPARRNYVYALIVAHFDSYMHREIQENTNDDSQNAECIGKLIITLNKMK